MIADTIAAELDVAARRVAAAIALLDEGNTVPFIARYRKEATGGLDDTQLRAIAERVTYLRELADRKETVLAAIEAQGKLSAELRALIAGCGSKARLEDLYLPFKRRRRTRADIARDAGLDALADALVARPDADPAELAADHLAEGFADAGAALAGARDIIVDRLATDPDLVGGTRERVWADGVLRAAVVEGREDSGAKYRDYFHHAERLTAMPGHRVLAMLRGEAEGVLSLSVDAGEDAVHEERVRAAGDLPRSPWLDRAVRAAWRTRLAPGAALDARNRLRERAEDEAVAVFARNLRDLLLAAPAGRRATLGLDPGYRNGVKCAVVDGTGKVLATAVVHPHQPTRRWDEARARLAELAADHGVELIAVGNGTASRETLRLAREVGELLAAAGGTAPQTVTVSEAGASVYSASAAAAAEFPDLDVSLRGAVSIARRLQDPLAELVKIDPRSIGVGQYQHDVSQAKLAAGLDAVVEDAVNAVGVEVNTASAALLARVAGVSATVAGNIVAHRDAHGAFTSRAELLEVPRLGPRAYEQCAGFLRIHGAANPLDASAVHPESYPVADRIAAAAGLGVAELIGNAAALGRLDPADFVDEAAGVGLPTVADILAELDKPGRDPRPAFRAAALREDVAEPADLVPGMILEGTVTNVAAFGAFVDIGVHQDGLVHVSALADRYVADPHEVVASGQVVRVKVLDVDLDRRRIGLSMRLADEPAAGSGRAGRGGRGARAADPGGSRGRRRTGGRGRGRGGGSGAGGGGAMAEALRRAGFDR